MGIVKISEELHDSAKVMARAMSRSVNAQTEFWMRVGKIVEENPAITYPEVLALLRKQAVLEEDVKYVSEDA